MAKAKVAAPDTRIILVRRAATIALAGNLVLALAKIITGFIAGSLAVIGDGIDSSTDVAIALMTLAVGFIISQPSDKEHPWGHARAETVATIVLAFIIVLAGMQLFHSSFEQIRSGVPRPLPALSALVVTVASIAGKLALAASQKALGKRTGSAMVLANAKNMANDVIISASVLTGLGLSWLFSLPLLDSLTALAVSLWVIKSGFGIFMELNQELMDGNADNGLYRSLFDAVASVPGAGNPHRARIRKMANLWDIDLDIEVDANKTVREGHRIAECVAEAVRRAIPDVYDIMVHVEPSGAGEHAEQYGLCERDVERESRPGEAAEGQRPAESPAE